MVGAVCSCFFDRGWAENEGPASTFGSAGFSESTASGAASLASGKASSFLVSSADAAAAAPAAASAAAAVSGAGTGSPALALSALALLSVSSPHEIALDERRRSETSSTALDAPAMPLLPRIILVLGLEMVIARVFPDSMKPLENRHTALGLFETRIFAFVAYVKGKTQ
jgi:hypothetical protein